MFISTVILGISYDLHLFVIYEMVRPMTLLRHWISKLTVYVWLYLHGHNIWFKRLTLYDVKCFKNLLVCEYKLTMALILGSTCYGVHFLLSMFSLHEMLSPRWTYKFGICNIVYSYKLSQSVL